MKLTAILVGVVALAAIAVQAQTPVAVAKPAVLQVSSVKESRENQPGALRIQPGGRIVAANIRVMDMVYMAFRASPPFLHDQIVGLPPWTSTVRYDIEAKLEGDDTTRPISRDTSSNIVGAYIRSVLDGRFGFQAHLEQRELPAYVLSVAPSGFKPPAASLNCDNPENKAACAVVDMPGHLAGHHVPFKELANSLPGLTSRPVVDQTGLTGQFDFDLQWNPDPLGDPNDVRPSIFGAVEAIGLKLDAARRFVDVLVIDHIERPMED